MASLESRNGKYSVVFRFGGRKFMRALKTSDEGDAEEYRLKVERRIRFVENGTLTIPDGANVADFLLGKTKVEKQGKRVTLKSLLDSFFESLSDGSLDESTVDTMEIHKRHLLRVIGGRFDAELLNLATLDAYAKKRTKEKVRGRTAGANTIRKELTTLRHVWMWGQKRGNVRASFPAIKDVALPKTKELPPFQTWEEIERQVEGLGRESGRDVPILRWESAARLVAGLRLVLPGVVDVPAVLTDELQEAGRMHLDRVQPAVRTGAQLQFDRLAVLDSLAVRVQKWLKAAW